MTFEELVRAYFSLDGWTDHCRQMAWFISGAVSEIFPEATDEQMQKMGLLMNVIFQLGRSQVEASDLEESLSYIPLRRQWPVKEN